MKILIALPIKSCPDPLLDASLAYLEKCRIRATIDTVFIPIKPHFSEEQKRERMVHEGNVLLKKTEGYFRIALTESGQLMSSKQFCLMLEKSMLKTSKIAFIIGGAFGLSEEVLTTADKTMSLSLMTLPHRMAYLMLAEQIFRAGEIMNNTAYHK